MAPRALALVVVVLLAFVAIGVVSLTGTMEGAQAAARLPELADDGAGRHLPGEPMLIEAELLGDGRTVILAPQAHAASVQSGDDLQTLGGACWFTDGKFYAVGTEGGGPKRVWLYAVVSDERPDVSVLQ